MEHVILKIVEDAGAYAELHKSKRVTDAHIVAAVRSDPDMARAFAGFCFTAADDVPKAIDKILPEDEQQTRKELAKESKARKDAKAAAAAAAAAADPAQD